MTATACRESCRPPDSKRGVLRSAPFVFWYDRGVNIVPVVVDHSLRVSAGLLGRDLAEQIFSELLIPNQAHEDAREYNVYGWEAIPAFHQLYDVHGDTVVLPRGYALRLKQLLRERGQRVDWRDRTRFVRGPDLGGQAIIHREHQPRAVAALRKHRQGIYKAPTGSGKTVTLCALLAELRPLRSLIVVDRINLVNQWRDRIRQYLDPPFEVGTIGEGVWEEDRITVGTVQAIWRVRNELIAEGWFDDWDLVSLDECHHVTAVTYRDLMARFTARYRFGKSATPDKTGDFELAKAVLGPVFHEDHHEPLRRQGVLITPTVQVVYSDFDYPYYGNHIADSKGNCQAPRCKNKRPHHRHRNNYQDLRKALVRDDSRNGLITEIIKDNSDHIVLVSTDEITQIEHIVQRMKHDGWQAMDDVYVMTSKEKGSKRDEILQTLADRGRGVLLSTVAGEGLDLPPIDRIILAFPTRNAKNVEQRVGRGTRPAAGKTDCIIYDIADNIGVLYQQFLERLHGCYQPLELPVHFVNKPDKRKRIGLENLGAR